METASDHKPAAEDQTFLRDYEGEARVLCAVTSHAATATVCSGYMVEWLWLSSPPPQSHAAIAPPAAEAGEDGTARSKGSADALADAARAKDGLDFVPAADMHGGRFVPA